MGQKTKKGDISIVPQENDIVRLRFRYEGKRYSLNVGSNEYKVIVAKIKLDIAKKTFDIQKYKSVKNNQENSSLSELYIRWVTEFKHGNLNTNSNFSQVLKIVNDTEDISQFPKLIDAEVSSSTYNRRRTTLSQFCDWLVVHNFIQKNPFLHISPRKSDHKVKTSRDPIDPSELLRILKAIKESKYGSHYYPFLYFMFRTGVRNEEAIGLRVKYVNQSFVQIREVLARGKQGTNAKYRIRKNTKNDKVRDIPIDNELWEVLKPLLINKPPDDLVFTSKTGLAIDDRQLQNRIIKPILKGLNIDHRDLYALARHSFASNCIDRGIPLTTISRLMGNTVATLTRNYSKSIEKPTDLPKLFENQKVTVNN